jgi:oligosaccharyltransferase complex subunit delta (ribophorin II)
LVATHKKLGCTEKLPSAVLDTVRASINKDASTVQEIFYNFYSFKHIDGLLEDAAKAKIAKNLQTILKKDDSLSSLGHAFYIASELGTHGAFAFNRVEDAIVQADEVDGKMLQFEGGLSITALIVNGIFK